MQSIVLLFAHNEGRGSETKWLVGVLPDNKNTEFVIRGLKKIHPTLTFIAIPCELGDYDVNGF
jgi:hypothetical protein